MLRLIATTLLLSAPLMAAAATLPSDLMRPVPEQAARGIAVSWEFRVEVESDRLTDIEPCRKVLAERGFYPLLSRTASSSAPALHFKLVGAKQYPQADVDADATLEAMRQASCPATLTWTVESKVRPAVH